MCKVSVVVAVYGVEKYITRCARSLFEQTLYDMEYIFIDDCSPDKSIDILKQLIEEYKARLVNEKKSVRIERMPKNSGQAAVRRYGRQLCKGEYTSHCDSDDWVDVQMYETMYNKAKESQSDVVICDYLITDAKKYEKNVRESVADANRFLEFCLLGRSSWSLCNKLIKRELYDNIEFPVGSMGEDLALTSQLLSKAKLISFVPRVFYFYYQNPNSLIHKSTESAILKKYTQLSDNTNIVIHQLEKLNRYKKLICRIKPYLLMNACIPLLALFESPKYREMWRQSCPHLTLGYLIKTPFPIYSKYTYLKYSIKYWFKK